MWNGFVGMGTGIRGKEIGERMNCHHLGEKYERQDERKTIVRDSQEMESIKLSDWHSTNKGMKESKILGSGCGEKKWMVETEEKQIWGKEERLHFRHVYTASMKVLK